jgi:hypothetical protein
MVRSQSSADDPFLSVVRARIEIDGDAAKQKQIALYVENRKADSMFARTAEVGFRES